MSLQVSHNYSSAQEIYAYKVDKANLKDDSIKTVNSSQSPANDDQSITLSKQGLSMQQSDSVFQMSTGSGIKNIDLDHYFEPQPAPIDIKAGMDNILLPSLDNLAVLQQHISSIFPGFLSQNGIPEAPDSITFDDRGKMVLPEDYPYKEELAQAFSDNPAMLKEIQTANALASHVAAIQATEPMREELAQAKNQFEIDTILEKYSEFLGKNRAQAYPEVSLKFSSTGELKIQTDGQALVS